MEGARGTPARDESFLSASLAALGSSLLKLGRYAEAERALRECLDSRTRIMPDAWPRFSAMSLLGNSLRQLARYVEAEPLLVQGYEGLKAREATLPPPTKARLPERAEWVIALYEAWGKPEQAARWQARLGRDRAPSELPADVFARP